MRKLFLIVAGAFTFLSSNVTAQDGGGTIGARFMPTISSLNVKNSDGVTYAEFTAGYGFGVYAGAFFNPHMGVQLEVQYNRLSQKYRDMDLDRRLHVDYVNIPLLFSLNTNRDAGVNFKVEAGPQFGINVGSRIDTKTEGDQTHVRGVLAVKQGDFGVAYGAGVDFGLIPGGNLRLDLGFRGVQGLIDISDDSKTIETSEYYILEKSRMQTYSLYAGLAFKF